MKLHEIKIEEEYARKKLRGEKMFEIRKNDRDYQVGDLIKYKVVTKPFPSGDHDHYLECIKATENCDQTVFEIEDNLYQITYITDYGQKDGYVVFGEKLLLTQKERRDERHFRTNQKENC